MKLSIRSFGHPKILENAVENAKDIVTLNGIVELIEAEDDFSSLKNHLEKIFGEKEFLFCFSETHRFNPDQLFTLFALFRRIVIGIATVTRARYLSKLIDDWISFHITDVASVYITGRPYKESGVDFFPFIEIFNDDQEDYEMSLLGSSMEDLDSARPGRLLPQSVPEAFKLKSDERLMAMTNRFDDAFYRIKNDYEVRKNNSLQKIKHTIWDDHYALKEIGLDHTLNHIRCISQRSPNAESFLTLSSEAMLKKMQITNAPFFVCIYADEKSTFIRDIYLVDQIGRVERVTPKDHLQSRHVSFYLLKDILYCASRGEKRIESKKGDIVADSKAVRLFFKNKSLPIGFNMDRARSDTSTHSYTYDINCPLPIVEIK